MKPKYESPEKTLTAAQKAFIEAKVAELGSAAAVKAFYCAKDDVSFYANSIMRQKKWAEEAAAQN